MSDGANKEKRMYNEKEKLTEEEFELLCDLYKDPKNAQEYIIHKAAEELKARRKADITETAEDEAKGQWILERHPNGEAYCLHCSICDDDFHYVGIKTVTNFCPNCGKPMEQEIKEYI